MPSVEQVFAWLIALPPVALYAAAFGFAFMENVFPPIPSDLFVGLCAFVAAPGEALVAVVLLSVLAGNISGAAVTFEIGRRYGAVGLRRRMDERGWLHREDKLEGMYARYGLLALLVGRIIPGIRPLVPPLAGALKISAGKTLGIISVAALLWYGSITAVASRAGEDWQEYADDLQSIARWGAGFGVVFVAIAIALTVWFLRKRRRTS